MERPYLSFNDAYIGHPTMREGISAGDIELIGRGGDQLVFSHGAYPDKVLKVSHRILSSPDFNGVAMDRMLPFMLDDEEDRIIKLQAEIHRANLSHTALRHVFGDRVIEERLYCNFLPLDGRTARFVWPDSPLEDYECRWFLTCFRLQDIVPQLIDREAYHTHDLRVGYIEPEFDDIPLYAYANQQLTGPKATEDSWEIFLRVCNNDSVRAFADMLDTDHDFQLSVRDFALKAIEFSELTGENLDLQQDNIIFSRENGHWDFKLVDALNPTSSVHVDRARNELRSFVSPLRVFYKASSYDMTANRALMNGLNYVRVINALNDRLGTGKRINLQCGEINEEGWGMILQRIKESYTGRPYFHFPSNKESR